MWQLLLHEHPNAVATINWNVPISASDGLRQLDSTTQGTTTAIRQPGASVDFLHLSTLSTQTNCCTKIGSHPNRRCLSASLCPSQPISAHLTPSGHGMETNLKLLALLEAQTARTLDWHLSSEAALTGCETGWSVLVVPQGFKPLLSPNICQHLSTISIISTILLEKCTEGMDLTISVGQGTRPARQICLAVKVCNKFLNLVMSLVLMSGGWKVWKLKTKPSQASSIAGFTKFRRFGQWRQPQLCFAYDERCVAAPASLFTGDGGLIRVVWHKSSRFRNVSSLDHGELNMDQHRPWRIKIRHPTHMLHGVTLVAFFGHK